MTAGSAALQQGDFAGAIGHYTTALDTEQLPRETIAITYLNRGLAYQRLGELVEAISDYDYALQQNVLTPAVRAVALYNRGLANRRLYRTTLALEDFTNALILNPRFAHAYNSRANILRELGYYSTAIEDYDAAIRYEHPHLHIPLYGTALARAALGDVPGAQRALAQALQSKDDYEPARVLLARLTDTATRPQTGETVVASGTDQIQTGSVATASRTEVSRTPAPFSEESTATESRTAQLPNEDIVATPAGGPEPQLASADTASVTDATPGQTQVFVPGPGFEAALERADALTAVSPTAEESGSMTTASIAPATHTDPAAATIPDGYMIQLSAQRDRDAATDVWNRIAEGNTDLLSEITPYIVEADLGSRGIFYRVRAGVFTSRSEGESLCRKLKSRRVDCYVVASDS